MYQITLTHGEKEGEWERTHAGKSLCKPQNHVCVGECPCSMAVLAFESAEPHALLASVAHERCQFMHCCDRSQSGGWQDCMTQYCAARYTKMLGLLPFLCGLMCVCVLLLLFVCLYACVVCMFVCV